jgi:isopropylmalate/homocitrate/citramalate synthase
VLAGAEVIHSTVTGIGERAGNTPMEETVLALLTLYGIDVGIKYNKLNELAQLVRELSATEIPRNRPYIGDIAYDIESGIVTSWFKNAWEEYPTDVFPVHPDFVGHRHTKIVMGKKSGLDNIAIWSEKLGIRLDKEEATEVLMQVKQRAYDLRRPLNEDEFRQIVNGVKAKKG